MLLKPPYEGLPRGLQSIDCQREMCVFQKCANDGAACP